jgi:DNA-cytosine methyltransferase
MIVLSLFDGMSCGQIALNRANIKYDKYYASEIKPIAIKCAKTNYPNTIFIGDVTKVSYKSGKLITENGIFEVGEIDLLLAGSPCQDFSALGSQQGLKGEKSKLFYEFLRIKNEISPKWFLLENVCLKEKDKAIIDGLVKAEGIKVNSKEYSFQSRNRMYWTNIKTLILFTYLSIFNLKKIC